MSLLLIFYFHLYIHIYIYSSHPFFTPFTHPHICIYKDFARVHKLAANEDILALTKGADAAPSNSKKTTFNLDIKVRSSYSFCFAFA